MNCTSKTFFFRTRDMFKEGKKETKTDASKKGKFFGSNTAHFGTDSFQKTNQFRQRRKRKARAKRKQTYVHTQQTMSRFILATSRI